MPGTVLEVHLKIDTSAQNNTHKWPRDRGLRSGSLGGRGRGRGIGSLFIQTFPSGKPGDLGTPLLHLPHRYNVKILTASLTLTFTPFSYVLSFILSPGISSLLHRSTFSDVATAPVSDFSCTSNHLLFQSDTVS